MKRFGAAPAQNQESEGGLVAPAEEGGSGGGRIQSASNYPQPNTQQEEEEEKKESLGDRVRSLISSGGSGYAASPGQEIGQPSR
jgi:hypothetical protein